MKALTIKQPWASLIMLGKKRIENRSWKPPASLMGERFVIHAGHGWSADAADLGLSGGLTKDAVPRGAALGTVRLVRIVTESRNRYFSGPYGWVLADPKPFPRPRRMNGVLGLWNYKP